MPSYLRKCVDCELEAITVDDLELFSKGYDSKHKRQNFCKSCSNKRIRVSDRVKDNKKNNKTKRKERCPEFLRSERHYFLRSKYGISIEEYEAIESSQSGKCAICTDVSDRTLHVDHCHDTGVIRGLLCSRCNTGLGLFKDSEENLLNAIKYLSLTAQEVALL